MFHCIKYDRITTTKMSWGGYIMSKTPKLSRRMLEYKNNFYKTYQSSVIPILKQFENNRKNKIVSLLFIDVLIVMVMIIPLIDIISGICFERDPIIPFIEMVVLIVSLVVIIVLPFNFNSKFIDTLKHSCMNQLLKIFGDIYWHDKSDIITDNELSESNLFGIYNTRTSYDAFEGKFQGVDFKICETEMKHITGSGKRRRIVNIFKGVIVKFKSNKDIKSNTIIATKGDKKIKNQNCVAGIGLLGSLQILTDLFKNGFNIETLIIFIVLVAIILGIVYLINKFSSRSDIKWQEIKLEDPEFTKKYKAYSGNQIEARYLITPAFMERFQNIQTAFGTNKVKCSFYGDSLMFAISTNKNLFEIGNLWKNLENPKQMETFFNELSSIFVLVEHFKLDEKTHL